MVHALGSCLADLHESYKAKQQSHIGLCSAPSAFLATRGNMTRVIHNGVLTGVSKRSVGPHSRQLQVKGAMSRTSAA